MWGWQSGKAPVLLGNGASRRLQRMIRVTPPPLTSDLAARGHFLPACHTEAANGRRRGGHETPLPPPQQTDSRTVPPLLLINDTAGMQRTRAGTARRRDERMIKRETPPPHRPPSISVPFGVSPRPLRLPPPLISLSSPPPRHCRTPPPPAHPLTGRIITLVHHCPEKSNNLNLHLPHTPGLNYFIDM